MNYYPTNFYSNYPYQNSYMQMQQQQQLTDEFLYLKLKQRVYPFFRFYI